MASQFCRLAKTGQSPRREGAPVPIISADKKHLKEHSTPNGRPLSKDEKVSLKFVRSASFSVSLLFAIMIVHKNRPIGIAPSGYVMKTVIG
jgi:hypothetical protein